MSPIRDVRVYIEDILEAIAKIEEYMAGLKAEDDFYNNTQIQDAVLRRLEIIGERRFKQLMQHLNLL